MLLSNYSMKGNSLCEFRFVSQYIVELYECAVNASNLRGVQ